MPRYFFHIIDDRAFVDEEGMEMGSVGDARIEAVRYAGNVLSLEETSLPNCNPWGMKVTDTAGDVVFALRFEAENYGY